jgi:xylulokinase
MGEAGVRMDVVYLGGGGAKSDLWSGIVSSVLNLPIMRLSVDEGPSFGAAILALCGTGSFSSPAEAARATLKIKDEIQPDREMAKVYAEAYTEFGRLYPALKPILTKSEPGKNS